MLNYHKNRRKWKIQLTTRTMYTKSRNIEIIMGNETYDTIEELCKSLFQNSKNDLKEPMKGSEFVPNSIDLLYCQLQKIGLKRGGSYIDSPKWLKN